MSSKDMLVTIDEINLNGFDFPKLFQPYPILNLTRINTRFQLMLRQHCSLRGTYMCVFIAKHFVIIDCNKCKGPILNDDGDFLWDFIVLAIHASGPLIIPS